MHRQISIPFVRYVLLVFSIIILSPRAVNIAVPTWAQNIFASLILFLVFLPHLSHLSSWDIVSSIIRHANSSPLSKVNYFDIKIVHPCDLCRYDEKFSRGWGSLSERSQLYPNAYTCLENYISLHPSRESKYKTETYGLWRNHLNSGS